VVGRGYLTSQLLTQQQQQQQQQQHIINSNLDQTIISASEVTTLWRYTNLFIIIIIIIKHLY